MTTNKFGYSSLLKEDVFAYTIVNKNGVKASILSFGAAVQSIILPWLGEDKDGSSVVLGYDKVEDYEINECYLGVAVGRVAGRIAHASFSIEGKEFKVTSNHGGHCLHGGTVGISRKNWTLVELLPNSVTLKCISPNGEEGFPGDMEIKIKYTLTSDNSLMIEYSAVVNDYPSPINLTNHSYFNLSGIKNVSRGIRDHVVNIQSSKTLELDEHLLPTGKIITLSPKLDLRQSNDRLENLLHLVGDYPKGFDNYYIFDKVDSEHCQATVTDGVTKMSLFTDQIGVQFYTSNFFDHVQCSHNHVHRQYGALCLEAQNYPDAVNHYTFPSIILKPVSEYVQKTIYKFEKC